MHFSSVFATVALAATAFGHGDEELQARREFLASHTNNLDHCASIHRASGLDERAIKRREELADHLLASKNLQSEAIWSQRGTTQTFY